ncbi:3-demethylubiquinol 3-O-methyltransferase [uncultured Candidatus Thioglobus sp.]|nr:3-demethylubiquinol 3-O-methyltransferase [uncultured Candidatus Thioglobus sp.]
MIRHAQNFDHAEQSKFDALATEWWDINGPLSILHDINPTRFKYIKRYTSLHNKKILDVGCGGGILTEIMALDGGLVTGIDIAKHLIRIASNHAQQTNIDICYRCTTIEELLPAEENKYEIITCMELLEHVPNPSSVINACSKLLKPKGWLFFSTINRNLRAYLQTKIIAEYLCKLLPIGTHDYAKYSYPSEIAAYCRACSLTVVDVSGFSYLPLLRRSYIKDKPDVHYFLCAQAI